ncbi:MAG: hypothetical protein U5N85_02950 [Arcicella sp.]|nr:hypothetical protein [Arcicella sp.]
MVKILDSLNTKLQANGSSEKLMMIGPSMGGLISRLAIRYMEQNNINHNLKLWVSFDSPHLGANIPIGFQQMVKFFADKLNPKMQSMDFLLCLHLLQSKCC